MDPADLPAQAIGTGQDLEPGVCQELHLKEIFDLHLIQTTFS
jgi:hypothetical protein